ncbi:class I SAM-dependent methyltransferase [Brevibacillus dissolubilis]|uniref:class I SAM-dependent methyltransferase n=1 Tax=Brevibacillus dissolubilis TaxID=1844116 RepID=UPI0011163DDB|nr:class I SAM-dependent methyltransferase [Brevibacillus dissolubilis]
MNLFFEIHQGLPREGPGDNESTKRAFSYVRDLPAHPEVLDIGCGPGMQTLQLADVIDGRVVALDLQQPFLDELQKRAKSAGVDQKIETVRGSMFELPFGDQQFDLIWSEGAIYILGFEQGLKQWKCFLKENGSLAVTEICWLKPNPPAEVQNFWHEHYPEMKSVEENLALIEAAGYEVTGYFTIPESGWWDDYYLPLEAKINDLRLTYQNQPEALSQLDEAQSEIEMYRKYSEWYGYTFFIMQAK